MSPRAGDAGSTQAIVRRTMQGLGLAMIALLFLWPGAVDKLLAWQATVAYVAQKGLPAPAWLAAAALGVEVLAPLALFDRRTRPGALAVLVVYTLATGLLFHDFWRADDASRSQLQHFCKNVALSGALLFMLAGHRSREEARVAGRMAGERPRVLPG